MNRKILTIILVFFLIVLIGIIIIKSNYLTPKVKTNSETSSNFMLNNNIIDKIDSSDEQNSGIHLGVTDKGEENYILVSIKIDKNASKEKQAKSLISSISDAIAYKIDINSITIEENKIKVDFAKTSAPFELENSQLSKQAEFFTVSDYSTRKTIFDSINKTFKSYFGADTEVYFSADSENIVIETEGSPTISIDSTQSYIPN